MCAGAYGKIGDEKVNVYMGYYGGELTVGDRVFSVRPDTADRITDEQMIEYLSSTYSAEEIARLFVTLVRDSDE